MRHWSIARALLAMVGVAVALAAFVNATPSLAYWSPWVLLASLAVTTLIAIVRTPRSPACVGFALFGWVLFIPTFWAGQPLPTESFARRLVEEMLQSRRPGPLPAECLVSFHDDGSVGIGWPSLSRIPPALQKAISINYNSYNVRIKSCNRVGTVLTIVVLGLVGAVAGRLIASRPKGEGEILDDLTNES